MDPMLFPYYLGNAILRSRRGTAPEQTRRPSANLAMLRTAVPCVLLLGSAGLVSSFPTAPARTGGAYLPSMSARVGPPDKARVIISPSVAKADFMNLGADLRAAVDGGAEWLHFSIQVSSASASSALRIASLQGRASRPQLSLACACA